MRIQPLISIIVPIYNTENTLKKCIDSIRQQTYSNIEILLIDDGSTDSSGKICDEFGKLDSRITVVHKTRVGVSVIRNTGLDMARGEYIGFVDSDDYIEPDMYEYLYSLIVKYNVKIATCGWIEEYNHKRVIHSNNPIEIVADKRRALKETIFRKHAAFNLMFSLYNKDSVFHSARFEPNTHYEDVGIYFKLMDGVDNVVISSVPKYHYVRYHNTITTSLQDIISFRQELDIDQKNMEYVENNCPELREIYFIRVYKIKFQVMCKVMLMMNDSETMGMFYRLRRELLNCSRRFAAIHEIGIFERCARIIFVRLAHLKLFQDMYASYYRLSFKKNN